MNVYIDINMQKRYELLKKSYRTGECVDRTEFIELLNSLIKIDKKYVCISSPEKNGKTFLSNLIASFYSKTINSRGYFERMYIRDTEQYFENLNRHNVIFMGMKSSKLFVGDYIDYICKVEENLIKKLADMYPSVRVNLNNSMRLNLEEVYLATGNKFIFVVDDWDFPLGIRKFERKSHIDYMKTMIDTICDCEYVELVCFTGKYPVSDFLKSKDTELFLEYELSDYKKEKSLIMA